MRTRFRSVLGNFFGAAVLTVGLVCSAAARDLVVTFFDCGQGDATLIETPGGKNILLDAGPTEEEGGFDAGRDVLAPYLQEHRIKRLDYLIFTHAHSDHIGGSKFLLNNVPVGQIYDVGYSYPSPVYKDVLDLINDRKIDYHVARAGAPMEWDPALKVKVLGPPQTLPWDNPNDNSMVIQVQHGEVTFLLTGDIEGEAEYELVIHQGALLKSQILKVPHHGSNTSSKPEFLGFVKPEVAVIMCGRKNRFRLPTAKIIDRYEKIGARVLRTDMDGNVRIISDGKKYRVEMQAK